MCEPNWVAIGGAGAMIAGIATAIYAWFTWRLWTTAKEDLNQTKKLHLVESRPWIEIRDCKINHEPSNWLDSLESGDAPTEEVDASVWIELHNYGKSPAQVTLWNVGWEQGSWSGENRLTVIMPNCSASGVFKLGGAATSEGVRYFVEVCYNAGASEGYRSFASFIYNPGVHNPGEAILPDTVDYT